MRTLERGAVYSGDKTVGFKCSRCGGVFPSMWGDICNKCRDDERKHQELLKAIRKARTGSKKI